MLSRVCANWLRLPSRAVRCHHLNGAASRDLSIYRAAAAGQNETNGSALFWSMSQFRPFSTTLNCRPRNAPSGPGYVRSTIIAGSILVGRSAWPSYVGKAAQAVLSPGPVEYRGLGPDWRVCYNRGWYQRVAMWGATPDRPRGKTAVLEAIRRLMERAAQLAMLSDGPPGPRSGADRRSSHSSWDASDC